VHIQNFDTSNVPASSTGTTINLTTIEPTVNAIEFGFMLSSRTGKRKDGTSTGLPEKYWQAIRLMEKYGDGECWNTSDNPKYKCREMKRSRAVWIIQRLNLKKRGGR